MHEARHLMRSGGLTTPSFFRSHGAATLSSSKAMLGGVELWYLGHGMTSKQHPTTIITEHDAEQVKRANAAERIPVVAKS